MRTQLESAVISVNKHLEGAVKNMSLLELLRNCHPIYRIDYARQLRREEMITENELKEIEEK